MADVTQLLGAAAAGDSKAAAELLPLVYDELRKLAAARMAAEAPGNTLQPTALVHEAYLRLVGNGRFHDRHHFFRVAAEGMRRVLVDRARQKRRGKRGGDRQRVPFSEAELAADVPSEELLALDVALERLAAVDPVKAELVTLRYFAGLSEKDAAAALGISRATASRYWTYARAWLIDAIGAENH
jgi:RNA polymerase sigma factor (TIGR02999 family)